MKYGKCLDCKKTKFLTKHHFDPIRWIWVCRECHDIRHDINLDKVNNRNAGRRNNGKYQPGTSKKKRK